MPTTHDTAELLALKARIEKLSIADRLRLCAALLDAGRGEIVETLVSHIVDELRLVRVLRHGAQDDGDSAA